MSKIVQFSDYQHAQEFSQPSKNGEKIVSQSGGEKIVETPVNMGLPAIPDSPLKDNSEEKGKQPPEKIKSSKAKPSKKNSPKPHLSAKPVVTATPGPEGYKIDCAKMTPGQLQAAYPSEYQSWKNSKNRCKKKGWPWADEWKTFNGFMLSMGPKPTPAHTLHRTVNALGAYGPDFCEWADKPTQNNNKSDNIKIVVPLTGEVFTAKKLAKLHGVKVQTVYKWKANFYSDLEMLAGKKSKPLRALSVALDELAASLPPKGKKLPVPFKIPEFSYPYDEWYPIDDDEDHYEETGEERATHYLAYKAEFDAHVEWIKRYNAGLSDLSELPQGKYYKPRIPPSYYAKEQAPKPKVPETYHGYEDPDDEDPGEDEDYAEDSAPYDDDHEDED